MKLPITSVLESVFRWLFVVSLLLIAVSSWYKDQLPTPDNFGHDVLRGPTQSPSGRDSFIVHVRDQAYRIEPNMDYELYGVVVSYSDADAIKNIWHHKRWKDFINVRDLCVIWGENVRSGVYLDMQFRSDSWTCWASWSQPEVGARFRMNALSNNHLLSDNPTIKRALMAAEPGDQIRLRGVLAGYANLDNGYARRTSLTRDDIGGGACETVYLDEFEIIKKGNIRARRLFAFGQWLALISGVGVVVMLPIAPVRIRRGI